LSAGPKIELVHY